MNTRIIFPRALKPFFWVNILKFFDAGTESRMENLGIRDGKIRIRDKHPGSATLARLCPPHKYKHRFLKEEEYLKEDDICSLL
jgi:hypothetical protein